MGKRQRKVVVMSDSWCAPIRSQSGTLVSGGAARNVRIAASGGMDQIVEEVSRDAATRALKKAENAVRRVNIKASNAG
ncbi:hypothetical protein [Roseospira goensis]|uniref:hypothetical protein n=1 Tax=Roseospira goensis TaxID=391922 RepID=UPI00161A9A55|nr:hypothetical protein [Roseospira goensis]